MATYPVGPGKTYTTIQAAITAAGAALDYDAQIPVDAGTYTADFTLHTRVPGNHSMPVHVYAADPLNRPVIVPAGGGYNITASNGQHADAGTRLPVFRNLIWSGGTNTNALVNASGGNPMHFIGCDFLSLTKIIFRYANAGVSHARRWEIRECRFDACTGGEVVSAADVGYGLIEGCRFRHTSGAFSMVLCTTSSNWLVYGNSVSTTAGGGYLFQCATAVGNSVHVVSSSPLKLFVTTGTFDYNVFNWAGSNSGTNGGHNVANAVPGFANPSTGDFSITTASSAYNRVPSMPDCTVDYLGTARPQGTNWDAGAYEVLATTTVSSITVIAATRIRLDLAASMASDASWATPNNFAITTYTGAAVAIDSTAASGNPGTSITLYTSEHTGGESYTVTWSGVTGITNGSAAYTGQGVPPTLSSHVLTSATTLRVVFSEPMRNDAALVLPASYLISSSGTAEFSPTLVTVVDTTTVDLTIDRQIIGIEGWLTVAGPADVAGNECYIVDATISPYTASVSAVSARTDGENFFVRLNLTNAIFKDATTWEAPGAVVFTGLPALTATFYWSGSAPAAYIDFLTNEPLETTHYTASWAGLSGITDGSTQFYGVAVPPVFSAESTADDTVRLSFSEVMSPTGLSDAGNYTITAVTPDDYAVLVSGVTAGGGNTFVDLTITGGVAGTAYLAGISSSVIDLAGNPAADRDAAYTSRKATLQLLSATTDTLVFTLSKRAPADSLTDTARWALSRQAPVWGLLPTVLTATPDDPLIAGSITLTTTLHSNNQNYRATFSSSLGVTAASVDYVGVGAEVSVTIAGLYFTKGTLVAVWVEQEAMFVDASFVEFTSDTSLFAVLPIQDPGTVTLIRVSDGARSTTAPYTYP